MRNPENEAAAARKVGRLSREVRRQSQAVKRWGQNRVWPLRVLAAMLSIWLESRAMGYARRADRMRKAFRDQLDANAGSHRPGRAAAFRRAARSRPY